jgi:hypothetical protein
MYVICDVLIAIKICESKKTYSGGTTFAREESFQEATRPQKCQQVLEGQQAVSSFLRSQNRAL